MRCSGMAVEYRKHLRKGYIVLFLSKKCGHA